MRSDRSGAWLTGCRQPATRLLDVGQRDVDGHLPGRAGQRQVDVGGQVGRAYEPLVDAADERAAARHRACDLVVALGQIGPEQGRAVPGEVHLDREHQPRTPTRHLSDHPVIDETSFAGRLLLVPALVELDLPAPVTKPQMPGIREVPALSSVLSPLTLKAIGQRRISHVDDIALDAGLATFAGLESLPKATALGTYSSR